MKSLRLSIGLFLLGCLPAAAAVAPVLPAQVVGSYQALLYTGDDTTGTPAGLITLTATSNGKATGKVTTDENKTYPFTATFNYVADATPDDSLLATSTNVAAISLIRTRPLTALGLSLTIEHHTDTVILKATLTGDGLPNRIATSGFRNVTFAPKIKADWAAKYTIAFEGAEAAAAGTPEGSGYATGIVATTGTMTLAGKTGDGVAFTASLPAGPNRNYVTYLNPYKTATSFLAGKINLVSRTPSGFHAVAAVSPAVDFQWKKAAKALDKSYPSGFEPVGLLVTMEPWAPLLPKQTLEQALEMPADNIFDIAFSSNFNTSTYAARTPISLGLDAKNVFYVAAGGAGSPSTLIQTNWTKFFTIKVNVATGVVTGTLTLVDVIPAPPSIPPKPAKTVTRKLIIEGVMLRLPTIGAEAFAAGYMTIPPLDVKTGTAVTAAFSFEGPFKADELAAGVATLAGNYRATFDLFTGAPLPVPAGIPADDAVVNFSIASDLKTMTFNGRKLNLLTDARPLNLLYNSPTNPNLVVTLHINNTTKELQKCDATYIKVAGFSAQMYNVLSRNDPQTIEKLP